VLHKRWGKKSEKKSLQKKGKGSLLYQRNGRFDSQTGKRREYTSRKKKYEEKRELCRKEDLKGKLIPKKALRPADATDINLRDELRRVQASEEDEGGNFSGLSLMLWGRGAPQA